MSERDVAIDAGREGWESGRKFERAEVVAFLRARASEANTDFLNTLAPSKSREVAWRRYTALSSAAFQIERGRHLAEDVALPCCDYRDHSGEHPVCACPEKRHAGSPIHPFAPQRTTP